VRVHWIENNTFLPTQNVLDLNDNGIYDYVSWIAPILSNQTFNIIVITKAEHLDSNRDFISDIFEEVKTLDGVWSETIPNQDYVRVTFEIPLTSNRDITLYPRVVSGNPRIEVYEFNQSELIAEFTSLNDNQYNKIFLTNLQGSQDTFDLRVVGGSVEFDHIIDPSVVVDTCASASNGDAAGTNTITSFVVNTGTDRAIFIGVTMFDGSGTVTGINFNTNEAFSLISRNAPGENVVELWNLTNPTVTTADIVITMTNDGEGTTAGACGFTGVDQTTSYSGLQTAGDTGSPHELTVTSTTGDMVFDTFACTECGPTVDGSQTQFNAEMPSDHEGVGSREAGATSVAMTWTSGGGGTVHSAINIKQAGAATNTAPQKPTLVFPVNTSNETSSTVVFTVNTTDGEDSTFSVSIYGNWTGSWVLNQTNSSALNNTDTNFSIASIPDGTWLWGANATDSGGLNNFSIINRTFFIDATNPLVSYLAQTEANNSNFSRDWVYVNITVTEPNRDSTTYVIFNLTGQWNSTIYSTSVDFINWTGLEDGVYYYNVTVNDTFEHTNTTETRFITLDNVAPVISLPVFTNGTFKTNTSFLIINISTIDLAFTSQSCVLNINGTNQTFLVVDNWCNTTNGNLTNLADGNRTITIFTNDTLDNGIFNTTFIVQMDSTNPTIGGKFINETSVNTDDAIRLNVTGIADNNLDTVLTTITYPNSTVVNVTLSSIGGNAFAINISVGGTAGTFYYNTTFVNDSAGNLASNTSILNVTVIAPNAAPTINVSSIAAITPNESGVNYTVFNFTVTDTDGGGTINFSTAEARFQLSGETTRLNTTCINTTGHAGNNLNFTCTIGMYYFDKNDANWIVNVTVKDNSNVSAINDSTNVQFSLLTSMVTGGALAWATLGLTDINTSADNNPVIVNNTGNANDLFINITAFNLEGLTTGGQFIFAGNISVENITAGCGFFSVPMINGTTADDQTNITSARLQSGNNSLSNSNATSGQEELFFCITGVNPDLSAQDYSSDSYGAWTIKIFAAAFLAFIGNNRRKKKKKKLKKSNKILKLLIKLTDELREEYSKEKETIIKQLIKAVYEEYSVKRKDVLSLIRKEINIPITIFSKELGALESLVKYMKENLNMNYHEIAKELNRDERTIWTAYKKAKEKQKEPIKIKETDISIPLSIFKDRKLTILESIIIYLKEKEMKYSEIAELIDRDQRNIWTIYSKARKKLSDEK